MRFGGLDLNQLVVLDALLATRSVTRAAEQLFLSQPATSCALARLRSHFGDELLVRVGKSLNPTPFASQLETPVREILIQIQAVTNNRPAFEPMTTHRKFIIEASDYVIAVFLAQAVGHVIDQAPRVEIDIRAINPRSREHLAHGDIDLLIVPEGSRAPEQGTEALFEDTISCLVWENSPLAEGDLSEEQYFEAKHVGVEWEGGRRLTLDSEILLAEGKQRAQNVIAPNFLLIPNLLVGSQRIATVPTRFARQMADRFPLKIAKCPILFPKLTEVIQWHRHLGHDPAIMWLRNALIDLRRTLDNELLLS